MGKTARSVPETNTVQQDLPNVFHVQLNHIPTLAPKFVSVPLGSSGQTGIVPPVQLTLSVAKDLLGAPNVQKSQRHILDQKSVHVRRESTGKAGTA